MPPTRKTRFYGGEPGLESCFKLTAQQMEIEQNDHKPDARPVGDVNETNKKQYSRVALFLYVAGQHIGWRLPTLERYRLTSVLFK